jgi:hypothetical protein
LYLTAYTDPETPLLPIRVYGVVALGRGYRTMVPPEDRALPLPYVVSARQRSGTTLLDIDYTVLDGDDHTVQVAALAFTGGGNDLDSAVLLNTLVEGTEGNIGPGISTGSVHRLTWDVGADVSTNYFEIEIEILAKDDHELMDFHFITIPSNGPDPELTISRSPVTQQDLLSLWYWLAASHDSAVSLVTGTVIGVSGAYSNKVLAAAAETTEDGRSFLFQRMDVRPASSSEVMRAMTGSTPGTTNLWEPRNRVGALPASVNEYGFDAAPRGVDAWWVVPLP